MEIILWQIDGRSTFRNKRSGLPQFSDCRIDLQPGARGYPDARDTGFLELTKKFEKPGNGPRHVRYQLIDGAIHNCGRGALKHA